MADADHRCIPDEIVYAVSHVFHISYIPLCSEIGEYGCLHLTISATADKARRGRIVNPREIEYNVSK